METTPDEFLELPEQSPEERLRNALLGPSDTWLRQTLSQDGPITPEWFEEINTLVVKASPELESGGYEQVLRRSAVVDARRMLLDMVGLHHARKKIEKANPYLVSSVQLIGICRLLSEYNIDVGRASTFPEVFTLAPANVPSKITGLRAGGR